MTMPADLAKCFPPPRPRVVAKDMRRAAWVSLCPRKGELESMWLKVPPHLAQEFRAMFSADRKPRVEEFLYIADCDPPGYVSVTARVKAATARKFHSAFLQWQLG
jgi:hypothetical protein